MTDNAAQPLAAADPVHDIYPPARPGRNGPGRLFVFEGIDCSGKDTQADLFTEFLRRTCGRDVYRCNLPDRKASVYGREIDAWLQPDRFTAHEPEIVKRLIGMLYQCDNVFSSQGIRRRLEQGQDVVLVRYILSSLVYQRDQIALMPLIRDNYARLMPHPDATVFIDVTAEESVARRAKRDAVKPAEFYEGNLPKMENLRGRYLDALQFVESMGHVSVYEDDMLVRQPEARDWLGHFVRVEGGEALWQPKILHGWIARQLADAGVL